MDNKEKNARLRDLENAKEKFKAEHNGIDEETFNNCFNILTKALGGSIESNSKYFIGTRKSSQSRIKFVQIIQDNWNYIIKNKYLKDEEIMFLTKIQGYLQFKSNCIVDDIHSRNAVPLTQVKLAAELGTSKQSVGRIVNNLVDKGIIVKAQGQRLNTNARSYALFINPNIMYSGDKNKLEETLKALFLNTKPLFKDFPITLF